MPEPISQLTIAVQILPSQFLAPILQPITQLLILAIANLIPEILPPSLLEIYLRIFLPHEAEYRQ